MRIAIANWSNRLVGGIETYVDAIAPGLADRGIDVALLHEMDRPEDRSPISLPDFAPSWCVEELGVDGCLAKLRDWEPNVVYSQGLLEVNLEVALTQVAPVFVFAHQYHGTCVGGPKTWKYPRPLPCTREFGWQCLLHYYPHRCGGWNPLTMAREYARQTKRLDTLRSCRGIVTHTAYMRREYVKHGFPPERVHKIPFPVVPAKSLQSAAMKENVSPQPPAKLLFLGRMDRLKGGEYLIGAAAKAGALLERPLQITFAGDGPNRSEWQSAAKHAEGMHSGLAFSFPGWVSEAERDELLANADLLVVPSLWPEPFGMVGIEAGRFGVPSAAYAVGGIPEWLLDGKNGHLSPGNPPTKQGLADAIRKCLADPVHHRELCAGAADMSRGYTTESHLDALLEILEQVSDDGSNS